MEKPYLRQLEEIPPFSVYQVDGRWVRENKNIEFTNFGDHTRFSFIPTYEFWIDNEHGNDETKFFVDRLLAKRLLVAKGVNPRKAFDETDKIEARERKKSLLKRTSLKGANYEKKVKQTHKELLECYSSDKLAVWVVHGELVRDLFYIDFTEGGHGFVYNFVPKNEIWLDDDLGQTEDRRFVLLHELHERALMSKGMPYEDAHRSASRLEILTRHKPDLLDTKLKEVLLENKSI